MVEVEIKRGEEAMFFPEELVTQILIRLPVKSLLRFKSVCKAWYNCISCQDFTFLHFNGYKPSEVLVADIIDSSQNILMSIVSVSSRGYAESATIVNHGVPLNKRPIRLIFSQDLSSQVCNSIFCFYSSGVNDMVLWNPSIDDFKIIDQSNLPRVVPISSMSIVEFGFDPKTSDYKILHIFINFNGGDFQLHIYSLLANSWRNLDASTFIDPKLLFFSPRLTIKSKIVWLTFDSELPLNTRQSQCQIYLFDLSTEMFDTITVSLEGVIFVRMIDIINDKINVFPFREFIALVISQAAEPTNSFEIWVLNDCSSTSTHSRSWSKLWTIQFQLHLVLEPLGFWENSYLIFRDTKKRNLVFYDLLNQDVVVHGAVGHQASNFKPTIYQESLINISNYH